MVRKAARRIPRAYVRRAYTHNTQMQAWHSVWHIKNVMIPELASKLEAENAKPPREQRPDIASNLQQVRVVWTMWRDSNHGAATQ